MLIFFSGNSFSLIKNRALLWRIKVLYCVSVSYKKANIDLRQKLAFSKEDCGRISSLLINAGIVDNCVVLSTCNRTEVYFSGGAFAQELVINALSEAACAARERLARCTVFYSGDNAAEHLFRVACGLESMVVGEDEILGQTKEAYLFAQNHGTASYELNVTFQAAIACAKRIKTETQLSKTSVSVATLAANAASAFAPDVSALVIGASGKTGSTVLKNLLSHKNVRVAAAVRSRDSAKSIIDGKAVTTVDYDRRYDCIESSNCIISATSSRGYTITSDSLKPHISDNKKRLFIDLAVPRDIESGVSKLGGVQLIDLDLFQKLAKDNNTRKLKSVCLAEQIIEQELDRLKKDLIFHDFLPTLRSVKERGDAESIEKMIYKMKDESSAEEFKSFLGVFDSFGGGA